VTLVNLVDGYVKSPVAGMVPWILMAIVSGPGRFEEAASAALGLTLFTLWIGWRRGAPIHALEVFGAVFFAVLAALGLVAPDGVIRWLEAWAGEVSSISLALFAVVTLLIGKPFTIAYAKDSTPSEHWDTPLFKRINYAISGVWAGSFTLSAIAGGLGDTVWRGSDFWTGWIVPLAGLLFAVAFTAFYPDYATATFAQSIGEPSDPPKSIVGLVDWLPAFILVTGIVGWVSDATSAALGLGLIAVGAVGMLAARKSQKVKT
jgi:hypothetical protein